MTAWRTFLSARTSRSTVPSLILGENVSKDGLAHTQTVESFFAIMKRGVTGTFHSVSE
jgi:hypothetical protein